MICIEVFIRVKMHNIQYAQEGRDLVKKKVLELSALLEGEETPIFKNKVCSNIITRLGNFIELEW